MEYDRATDSPTDRRLTELIATDGDIAVSEPILMEVLAGAKDEKSWSELRRLLTSFGWIAAEAATDFEGAARMYRSCRRRGVTPGGLIDCMIASIALRSNSDLLTADTDFTQMSRVIPLSLDQSVR